LQKAVYAKRSTEREQASFSSRTAPTSVAPPKVPPREIQRMLRSGMTPQQVARAADLDVAYIEQFFAPVLYERGGIVRDAQALYLEKARLGLSGLPLGDAVALNLEQRRVRMTDEAFANSWTASRQGDRPWVVTVTYPFRGRARKASWRFDPRERSLVPLNKAALDIGWVANGGKRRAAARNAPAAPSGEPTSARKRKRTAKKPARRKPATRKKTSSRKKPAARKKTTARRKPAARKKTAVRRKSTARRKPAARRRAAPKKRTAKRTAKRRAR
jgi:hypothetical protein